MHSQTYRILHLSDIHFGQVNLHVIDLIPKDIDLLILTGDLTQRAKRTQFNAALEFFERFNCPIFLIPGNHDVPLYNFFLRIFNPYRRYKKFMKDYLSDFYENETVAVFGLWTLNPLTVQSGKLYSKQLARMREKMSEIPSTKVRIIAAHHPLLHIDSSPGAPQLQKILNINPDLMMWGHEHQSSAEYLDPEQEKGPILLAAGTGFSSRTRTESNSYNLITLDVNHIGVEIWNFSEDEMRFELGSFENFKRSQTRTPETEA